MYRYRCFGPVIRRSGALAIVLLLHLTGLTLSADAIAQGTTFEPYRCETETDFDDWLDHRTGCVPITGSASVTDWGFGYRIERLSGAHIEVRWKRDGVVVASITYIRRTDMPGYDIPCLGYWPEYAAGNIVTFWRDHCDRSGRLTTSDIGNWLFEVERDGVIVTSIPFTVHGLTLQPASPTTTNAIVDQYLPAPLQMRMTTFEGKPADDIVVSFSQDSQPAGAAGFIVPSPAFTDISGVARMTPRIGDLPGEYRVRSFSSWAPGQETTFVINGVDSLDDLNPEIDHPEVEEGIGQKRGGPEQCDNVGNPISVSTGNKFQREVDMPRTGLSPIEFVRYHNSLGFRADSFRNFWTHSYDRRVLLPSDPQTEPVKVLRPDGRKINFFPNGGNYQPNPGVNDQLIPMAGGWQFIDEDQRVEQFDDQGLWISISDPRGIVQTALRDAGGRLIGVSDNTGRSLTLSHDSENRIDSVQDNGGRTWNYRYDSLGRLEFVDRPDGSSRQYHYEDLRHPYALTGITSERLWRHSVYEYDAEGRAIASYNPAISSLLGDVNRVDVSYDLSGERLVMDPLGNETAYQTRMENRRGVLEGITGPACSEGCGLTDSQFTYDAALNVSSQTVFGVTTSFGPYDTKGQTAYRIEAVGTPEERRADYEYDPRFINRPTRITEPSVFPGGEKITTRSYNAVGDLLSETIDGFTPEGLPVSRTVTHAYDGPWGQRSSSDGPRTNVSDIVQYLYYPADPAEGSNQGRLKTVINANGVSIRDNIQYTPSGKVLSETQPNGVTISHVYDPDADRRLSTTVSGGGVDLITEWTYEVDGQVKTITRRDNRTGEAYLSHFDYDRYGRLDRSSKSALHEGQSSGYFIDSQYYFDLSGNVTAEERTSVQYPGFVPTLTRSYDEYSRVDQVTLGGVTEDYDYHPDGTLAARTDGRLNTTTYEYDALDRLTMTIEPGGVITLRDYNVHGNLVQVTDPEGHITLYRYDDLGNRLAVVSPDTGETTYQYNAAGLLVASTDAKGNGETRSYDAAGRLLTVDREGTEYDEVHGYDTCANGVNRLCSVSLGWGHLTDYEYNALGEVTAVVQDGIRLEYAYGPQSALRGIRYPSGRWLDFTLHHPGQPQSATVRLDAASTLALVDDIQYSPDDRATGWQLANGLQRTTTFDNRLRPTAIQVAGVYQWQASQYDASDNLLQLGDHNGSHSFGYDALNRLTSAQTPAGSHQYTYDRLGNRLSRTVDGIQDNGTYQSGSSRLDVFGDLDYSLDANGSTLQTLDGGGQGQTMTYTGHNRLLSISEQPGGQLRQQNQYDYRGRRVHKTGIDDRRFIYGQNDELLAELAADGTVLHEYVYIAGTPVVDLGPVMVPDIPNLGQAIIIDDLDAFRAGNWQSKRLNQAEGGEYSFARKLDGRIITWKFTTAVSESGYYDVALKWVRDPDAGWTYYLRHPYGQPSYLQQFVHAQHSAGEWIDLGSEYVPRDPNSVSGLVRLSGADNTADAVKPGLHADAVRLTRVLGPKDLINPTYIHTDHLGTPQIATDDEGTAVWSANYAPFGKAAVDEDPDGDGIPYELNLRFPGQYFDQESGYHQNYFRDYDPGLGRYIEGDPMGLGGGVNLYAYAANRPMILTDPTGLIPTIRGFNSEDESRLRAAVAQAVETIKNCKSTGDCEEKDRERYLKDAELDFLASIIASVRIEPLPSNQDCGQASRNIVANTIYVSQLGFDGQCCGGLPGTIAHESAHLVHGGGESIPTDIVSFCFGCD